MKISAIITESIGRFVPKFTHNNNTMRYVNHRIKSLQKCKRHLVSLLHHFHIIDPYSRLPTTRLAKESLKFINKDFQSEFKLAIEKFWTNFIKKIDHRRPESFFPKINAIFRAKLWNEVEDLHIGFDDKDIVQRSRCNTTNAVTSNNNYTFSDTLPSKTICRQGIK